MGETTKGYTHAAAEAALRDRAPELAELVRRAGTANYECGAWRESDDEPDPEWPEPTYEQVYRACLRAERRLMVAILALLPATRAAAPAPEGRADG